MAAPTYLPLERPEPRADFRSRETTKDGTAVGIVAFVATLFGLGVALYLLSRRR